MKCKKIGICEPKINVNNQNPKLFILSSDENTKL